MSWRELLGVVSSSKNIDTQYPHNTHNVNSADIAEYAGYKSKKIRSDARPSKKKSFPRIVVNNKNPDVRRRGNNVHDVHKFTETDQNLDSSASDCELVNMVNVKSGKKKQSEKEGSAEDDLL